jgi:hypothetical protein
VVNQHTPAIPGGAGYAEAPWGQARVTIAGSGPARRHPRSAGVPPESRLRPAHAADEA